MQGRSLVSVKWVCPRGRDPVSKCQGTDSGCSYLTAFPSAEVGLRGEFLHSCLIQPVGPIFCGSLIQMTSLSKDQVTLDLNTSSQASVKTRFFGKQLILPQWPSSLLTWAPGETLMWKTQTWKRQHLLSVCPETQNPGVLKDGLVGPLLLHFCSFFLS